MKNTNEALIEKIQEMYPEIREHRLSVSVYFDTLKNAYLVTFTRDSRTLSTHLEKKDADECLNGIKCVYLGVQIEQFIRNYEEKEAFERSAR